MGRPVRWLIPIHYSSSRHCTGGAGDTVRPGLSSPCLPWPCGCTSRLRADRRKQIGWRLPCHRGTLFEEGTLHRLMHSVGRLENTIQHVYNMSVSLKSSYGYKHIKLCSVVTNNALWYADYVHT